MRIKLKAPDGYKYHDSFTDRDYSEIVVNEKERGRYALVPSNNDPTVEL